jgi:hypothetical protein
MSGISHRPTLTRPYAHLSLEQLKQQWEQIAGNNSPEEPSIAAEIRIREIEDNISTIGKAIEKPHWTVVPIYLISLIALIVSLAAYFLPQQSVGRDVQSSANHHESEKESVSSSLTLTESSQKSKPVSH